MPLLVVMQFFNAAAVGSQEVESQIKAAYLGRFLGFIEREGETEVIVQENSAPLICVYGDASIVAALKALDILPRPQMQKTFHREIKSLDEIADCTLVFLGKADSGNMRQSLQKLSDGKFITVSDSPGFASAGGMIELINEGVHIKFILNRVAAKTAGVRFSVQLLSLAKEVIEQ